MKYYIDTEFIEGFHRPPFSNRRHHIDLISIGILAEDGSSYYAVSNEFNPKDASEWVKEHVIKPLGNDIPIAKSNKRIGRDLTNFIYLCEYPMAHSSAQKAFVTAGKINPVFYGYFADYDWVLFCSLFGTMMDLPKGFPKYCRDLKQMLDERVESEITNPSTIWMRDNTNPTMGFDEALKIIKDTHPDYPRRQNEHNALADARWNKQLHEFILNL